MTHSPPPDRPPPEQEPLGFDDSVGIFVAFISLGAVLLWGLTQNNQGFNFSLLEAAPKIPPAASLSPLSRSPAPTVSGAIAPPAVPISALPPQPSESTVLPRVIPFSPKVSASPHIVQPQP